MLGFGGQKKKLDAIALAAVMLEPIYEFHFRRRMPDGLARVLVEGSFSMETLKGPGRALLPVEALVHAVEALKAGYRFLDLEDEAKTACAAALERVIRTALQTAGADSFPPVHAQYLSITGETLRADVRWREAIDRLSSYQVATAVREPASHA